MKDQRMLSERRSARAGTAAAKVVALRGGMATNAGFDGMQLMLEGMRIMVQSNVGWPRLFLVARESGYALFLQISHGPRVWLIAERSKRVRIFKQIETALGVCKELGAGRVAVLLDEAELATIGK